MRCFKVDVRKEPTEYGFMPTMQMYLLEEPEKKRPIVLIAPGGGYTMLCIEADGKKQLCSIMLQVFMLRCSATV